jgi:hypothetical protein
MRPGTKCESTSFHAVGPQHELPTLTQRNVHIMLPIVPPSVLRDIALEHYKEVSAVTQRRATDPDRYYANHANQDLAPDPVFMGLRALTERGLLGRLLRAIDRGIEAREERRYGAQEPAFAHEPAPLAEFQHRDRTDSDIAA